MAAQLTREGSIGYKTPMNYDQQRFNKDIEDLNKYIDSQNKQKMEKSENPTYKVFNIKDLLTELQFEGRGKGSKTEVYLESVIKRINETKNYRWVQFFQLVDVFFVVVETGSFSVAPSRPVKKGTFEEINDHYNQPSPKLGKTSEETKKNFEKAKPEPEQVAVEILPPKENYVKQNLKKEALPWAKK